MWYLGNKKGYMGNLRLHASNKTANIFLLFIFAIFSIQVNAQVLFQDRTSVAGPFHVGESWGASWGEMNGDLYPDLFVSNHGMLNSLYQNNGDGTFTDVVATADTEGVWTSEPNSDIHGGSWGDIDNDGDQDILVTRSSIGARVHLFKNNGSGLFTEDGGANGIGGYGGGRMPMFFDYNNDGRLDAAVARNSGGLEMFRRNANNYTNVSSSVGIGNLCNRDHYAIISRLFDNGNLVYLCVPESELPSYAWDMSTIPFTDVTNKIGTSANSNSTGLGTNADTALADFDNDLKNDLFVLNTRVRPSGAKRISANRIEAWLSTSTEKSFTFKANGSITVDLYARVVDNPNYVRIGASGYHPPKVPFTLSPTNSNNNGVVPNRDDQLSVNVEYDQGAQEWTIYLNGGPFSNEHVYFKVTGSGFNTPTVAGLNGVDLAKAPTFLMNNGTELVKSGSRGVGAVMCGGVTAADFDNDMDKDLYLVCRSSMENFANRIYWNNGDGTFTLGGTHGAEGAIGAGIDSPAGTGEMAVSADMDLNGFVDVFVTNGNRLFPHIVKDKFTAGGSDQLFKNLGNSNGSIMIDLQGVNSNRDGFGTRVIVSAGGVSQLQEYTGRYHRWSHDHNRLHFGLGQNNSATVTIEWPDGTTDVYSNVAANKLYKAVQGANNLQALKTFSGGNNNNPTLTIGNDSVNEGGTASLTVNLSPASSSTVTVDYQTVNGSAQSGSDYTAKSGTLTFSPNQTSKTITVQSLQDTQFEGNENFTVQLSNASNAGIAQTTGTVTIIDDDPQGGGVTVSVSDVTVSEAGSSAAFTISLSDVSTSTVDVDYNTADGTATAGSDYTARSGNVSFAPGETSKVRSVVILQDSQSEPDETFTMQLSNPVNGALGQATGTATIQDDDTNGGGGTTISVSGVTVSEGDGTAAFTFSLSQASTSNVIIDYATADGTANAGSDYTTRTGRIIFSPGQTSKVRTVVILQDSQSESDETFTMQLSNPVNVTLGQATATATIQDDDSGGGGGGNTISVSDVQVPEGGGKAAFTISLSQASTQTVVIDYATANGSAIAGSDYTTRTGRIVFSPGQTSKVRTVNITQDNAQEPNETFTMQLSNPKNINLGQATGTATILDDDGGGGGGGSACGQPNINTAVDRQIFIWQDCSGDGTWYVRGTAGDGTAITYDGDITSTGTFSNVQPYSLESTDVLDSSNSNVIDFRMTISSIWQDGFEFKVTSGTTCFDLDIPSGQNVIVGASRTSVTPPFNIETLGSCP